MGQLCVYLPPFASDYSGVCSALFDLDCLTIIADASCCTAHYVYFDEPRWKDQVKPVFSIALRNVDAVLGNDAKIVNEVCDASHQISTNMIAVVGTPIPAITGMDVEGIASEVEKLTGKISFGFNTTGFNYYDTGIVKTGKALLKRFAEKRPTRKNCVNIIGITPLDFGAKSNNEDLKQLLISQGYEINSDLFMDTSVEQIAKCSEAEINIATSASGLQLCSYLFKCFGTPYMTSLPIGQAYQQQWFEALKNPRLTGRTYSSGCNSKRLLIIHDQVIGNSIRCALRHLGASFNISVASFFTWNRDISEPEDIFFSNETQFISHLKEKHYDAIMGDELIINTPPAKTMTKIEEPHPAVSSKLGWDKASAFFTTGYEEKLQGIIRELN